jgi:putative oxidoreductase
MSTAAAVPATSAEVPRSKGLHIGLWVAQVLLAFAFLMAGGMKVFGPMAPQMNEMGRPLVLFIGISELLGALGMILPAATRMKPKLTALAGVGLFTVMVLATIFHISRGEFSSLPPVAILGSLAAFVAWGRFKKAPIAPRG